MGNREADMVKQARDVIAADATVDSAQPRRGNHVQSLDRALDVLEALAAAGGEIGLSELSERVGLHVSTVHRLLAMLVSRGYARQSGPSGRYALGPQVLKLAMSAVGSGQFDLRQETRPILRELVERSGETTNLVVMPDTHVVYVDQAASRHMVRMFTQIGTRAPAYCTAAGKAILAYRGEPELAAYLSRAQFEQHTAQTITSAEKLHAALARIRERGYAIDEGEMEEGVRCVAAPIFDYTGAAIAAISISGPAARFQPERARDVVPALLAATAALSARLGYRAPKLDGVR